MARKHNENRLLVGVLLLVAGFLLLAYKMGAPLPYWLFTWPVLLISIGLIIGIQNRFRNPGGIILIILGSIFLSDKLIPGINLGNYIAPIIIICIGLVFIFRPKRNWQHCNNYKSAKERWIKDVTADNQPEEGKQGLNEGEFINSTSVFGGVKRTILSKNFRGGELTCFMGGAEINLLQSDIQQPVSLEITAVFGGAKIIVPANWDIKNEVSAVFGGVEDKRPLQAGINFDARKTLIISGSAVFGGIEINSY